MARKNTTEYTLGELSAKSGVPSRTIRLYISRGILDNPIRAGRDAAYGTAHLERLEEIKRLKDQGLTLHEIGITLNNSTSNALPLQPQQCLTYELSDDVTVIVRADVAPWKANRIRNVLGRMSALLQDENEEEE